MFMRTLNNSVPGKPVEVLQFVNYEQRYSVSSTSDYL